MIIVMSCTKNWYHYLCVDIFALLSTNKVKKIYIFIEENENKEIKYICNYFKTKVIIKNYHELLNKYVSKKCPNIKTLFTLAATTRLFLPKEIKEKKILYLDTDSIVLKNIYDLWKIKMNNYYIAGVQDLNSLNYIDYLDKKNINEKCINAGVCLLNLDLIRKNKKDLEIIKLFNTENFVFLDQDILNKALHSKSLFIDNKYNSSYATGFSNNISIIHYVYKKNNWIKKHSYNNLWYDWEKEYNKFILNQLKIVSINKKSE
jgi:lipopolysaccharide biosynthesis glycosyltransferase